MVPHRDRQPCLTLHRELTVPVTSIDGRRSLWLLPFRSVFRAAHVTVNDALALGHALRRMRLVGGLRLRSAWHRAPLSCSVSSDVRFGRRVRFIVTAKTANELRMGRGCTIGDDVRIELRGGSLSLGEKVDLRRQCVLGVQGTLEMQGNNLVQHGSTFHCDDAITLGPRAVVSEYATVVDSSHAHDGPHDWFLHNLRATPVVIREGAWIGAKATVARGVHVGAHAVIGANSVVVKDVPDGHLASGVPARVLRPVDPAAHPVTAQSPVVSELSGSQARASSSPPPSSADIEAEPTSASTPNNSS